MRRNLNGTHTHALYSVEHGVKGWRLDDNRVTWLADCLQTQVNRLSGTDRNDHFIWIHRRPILKVAPCDLTNQIRVSWRQRVSDAPRLLLPADRIGVAIDLIGGEQSWVWIRRAKRNGLIGPNRAQRR